MGKLFQIVGLLTIIAAVLYASVVKTAFQETTIAILWCGGWLLMAVGPIIRRLDDLKEIRKSSEEQAEALQALIDRRIANNRA